MLLRSNGQFGNGVGGSTGQFSSLSMHEMRYVCRISLSLSSSSSLAHIYSISEKNKKRKLHTSTINFHPSPAHHSSSSMNSSCVVRTLRTHAFSLSSLFLAAAEKKDM